MKDRPAVGHAAQEDTRAEGEPAAHSALGHPERREERGGRGEESRRTFAAPAGLRGNNHRRRADRERNPVRGDREHENGGEHRELDREARGARDLVVRLSYALRPEVSRGRWAPKDVRAVENGLSAARRAHGAHELEVLEHDASVIPIRRLQARAANAERAGPVAAGEAIEKHAAGVPAGVPWKRLKVILRTHDIGRRERGHHLRERRIVVAHVIVRDDDGLVRREPEASEHAAHLAHGRYEIGSGRDVTGGGAPLALMRREDRRFRSIHHDHLGARGDPLDVRAEVGRRVWRRAFNREDVAHGLAIRLVHDRRRGNRHTARGIDPA